MRNRWNSYGIPLNSYEFQWNPMHSIGLRRDAKLHLAPLTPAHENVPDFLLPKVATLGRRKFWTFCPIPEYGPAGAMSGGKVGRNSCGNTPPQKSVIPRTPLFSGLLGFTDPVYRVRIPHHDSSQKAPSLRSGARGGRSPPRWAEGILHIDKTCDSVHLQRNPPI